MVFFLNWNRNNPKLEGQGREAENRRYPEAAASEAVTLFELEKLSKTTEFF